MSWREPWITPQRPSSNLGSHFCLQGDLGPQSFDLGNGYEIPPFSVLLGPSQGPNLSSAAEHCPGLWGQKALGLHLEPRPQALWARTPPPWRCQWGAPGGVTFNPTTALFYE